MRFKYFSLRRFSLCILLFACSSFAFISDAGTAGRQETIREKGKKGMVFYLSEGKEELSQRPESKTRDARNLSDEAANELFKRLSPIKSDEGDEKEFALRDRSLPPPKTGKVISEDFPSIDSAGAPDIVSAGPLQITRFAPEGDVGLAPHLSVSFSQPMIALTSNSDIAAVEPPVRVSPRPKGRWRWIGTKTVLFEPDGRFPMATTYVVEIPAGTGSIAGNAIQEAKRWTFSTPALRIVSRHPQGESQPRDPLCFIEFDQKIDPQKVLPHLAMQTGAGRRRVRLATETEISKDKEVTRLIASVEKGRWIAFKKAGAAPLPGDENVDVVVMPGAPSAEGSRVTTEAQKFSFETYGSFEFQKKSCGYNGACRPGDAWGLEFNNSIDEESFDQKLISIEPALPGMKAMVFGDSIHITGESRARTGYRVTISPLLKDIFGQKLGKAVTAVFNVGKSEPYLYLPGDDHAILDPYGPRSFSIYSVNHKNFTYKLYSVGPENWGGFADYKKLRFERDRAQTPPGALVKSQTITIDATPDRMIETRIDLSPALKNGFGHAILVVEPEIVEVNARGRNSVCVWIQSTSIGLNALSDRNEMLVWATSLKDGIPVGDARIELLQTDQTGAPESKAATNAEGLARLQLSESEGDRILVAKKGDDAAILSAGSPSWRGYSDGRWQKKKTQDGLSWYVIDDRGMYRPGEEVRIKGWLRRITAGKLGDVALLNGAVKQIEYTLTDQQQNKILQGALPVNAMGGFAAALKLPGNMNLGHAALSLKAKTEEQLSDSTAAHYFRVEEFRRPEYEVKTATSAAPHFIKDHAMVTVSANYYAGGGLQDADVEWSVRAIETSFTPPNRGDFTFGRWIPWWRDFDGDDESASQDFAGMTDASGKHRLRLDFISANPPRPYSIEAVASVTDVNRQTWAATSTLLVHPASLYVGLRTDAPFVKQGEPLIVKSIVVDLDGKAIANREIRMRAVRLNWAYRKGEWVEEEADPQECIVKSGVDPVECKFTTTLGGNYRIAATIIDDRERPNQSELTICVAGGSLPPFNEAEEDELTLIPNRENYAAGDVAEILVQAPFYPAEGLLTLQRSGIVSEERFVVAGPSHILKVPIKESFTPNLHLQVDLVGAAVRTDKAGKRLENLPKRPAFATGRLKLSVPPVSRKLALTVTPRETALEPGGETSVDVQVRDAGGSPVRGGEVALIVVDESVLALSNYKLTDPIEVFYRDREADVFYNRSREEVVLADASQIASVSKGRAGGEASVGAAMAVASPAPPDPSAKPVADNAQAFDFSLKGTVSEPIRTRMNFDALATFAAAETTDINGRATVKFKLPDNLTRYRVMAVAAGGENRFGMAESAIVARLPLMVRPSAPRFLNFGDKFELPIVVQNQTDQPMEVDLAARAHNAQFTSGAGRQVTVPANDRVEVRLPAAAVKPGFARFQIAAVSGKWSDSAELSLPVWTPATTEAFATYGEIDAGAIIQPVKAPADAISQFGGLELTTSSTQLQSLTDAVIYLTNYPFECAEQISSRVLAIGALRDALGAFDAKGLPKPEELRASVDRDIKRLQGMQNDDGGFGFWRRSETSWPFLSVHAAHALGRAKEKGFDVPAEMLEKSRKYLREIQTRFPSNYGVEARRVLTAYALYTRNRLGERDAAGARSLIFAAGGADKLPLEAAGWLLPVLSSDAGSRNEAAAIRRHLANRVEETAATAHFTTSYDDGAHLLLHSSRRADGIILESLIVDDPKNDLIPKLVRGLLAHRKQGRWENTQENAFALLALDRYFDAYEKEAPNFTSRAWLGEAFVGSREFRGRTTDSYQLNVPMMFLLNQGGSQNFVLSKEGSGRLYYRLGMQYAPADLRIKPADYGFTVSRSYEAIDDPNDVRREEDGTWRIKAGAQVRVRLTMVAPSRRYHVALVDYLPAGFETVNPALAVTGRLPEDPKRRSWFDWFEHQNLRDERVEAFTSLLWDGVYNYSYIAKATTPGIFVAPPAKAEEMYHPETFGRCATDRVVIE